MQIIPEKAAEYVKWRAKQTDDYSLRCFTYAEEWADLIEKRMASGETLSDCAEETSHEADIDGITGFMYGAAVSILASAWVHGDALRRWYNLKTQLGTEGVEANEKGTTLNPALLRVGE